MKRNFKPAFSAWIISWAVTTFASAAILAGRIETNFLDWARHWFDIADAIPPLAKIAFGVTLAAGFWITGKFRFTRWLSFITLVVMVVAAFIIATTVYPFRYYESFSLMSFWPYHLIAAVFGACAGYFALHRARAKER